MELKTEYEFILPRGYVDAEGNLHREGVMRLANAKDETDHFLRLAGFDHRAGTTPTRGWGPGRRPRC